MEVDDLRVEKNGCGCLGYDVRGVWMDAHKLRVALICVGLNGLFDWDKEK